MESVWKQRKPLGFQMFPLEGLSIRYNTRCHLLTSRHGERPPWLGDMDFECPPHPLASLRQAFFPLDPSPLLPPTASKSHFCKPNNCEPVLILYSDSCLYIPSINQARKDTLYCCFQILINASGWVVAAFSSEMIRKKRVKRFTFCSVISIHRWSPPYKQDLAFQCTKCIIWALEKAVKYSC